MFVPQIQLSMTVCPLRIFDKQFSPTYLHTAPYDASKSEMFMMTNTNVCDVKQSSLSPKFKCTDINVGYPTVVVKKSLHTAR